MKVALDRSAREAAEFEATTNSRLRDTLNRDGPTVRWFEDFAPPYRVARSIPRSSRQKAMQIIRQELWEPMTRGIEKTAGIRLVEEVARQLQFSNLTTNRARPTSCLSKIAFLTCPLQFSPYDSNARKALHDRLNVNLIEHDYRQFMNAFNIAFEREKTAIRMACTSSDVKSHAMSLGLSEKLLSENWWLRRVLDWQLWLEGRPEPVRR